MEQLKRKLNCLLIENDDIAAQRIKQFIDLIGSLELVKQCRTVTEAHPLLGIITIDLILVNADVSSEKDLEYLKLGSTRSLIILLTDDPLYDIIQLDQRIFDCLVKPVTESRFRLAYHRLRSHFLHEQQLAAKPGRTNSSPTILVKSGAEQHQLLTSDIVYIESDGEYLKYHTEKGRFMALGSLRRLANSLNSDFVQVHRSYVVNRAYVIAKTRQQLELVGNRIIPIGKTYKNAFQFVSSAVIL